MKDALVSPTALPVLHYAGFHPEAGYRAPHHHPDWVELLLVTEGTAHYTINGQGYDIRPQSLVILNQGVWHEEVPEQGQTNGMYYASFSGFPLAGLETGEFIAGGTSPVVHVEKHYPILKEQFHRLAVEFEAGHPEGSSMLRFQLGQLLVSLVRILHHHPKLPPPRGRGSQEQVSVKVRKYIQENYAKPITLEDMAQTVFVSTYHLCRLFKQTVGLSPVQYLIRYRIEVAKHYLDTTDLPNDRIAEMTGYVHLGHFYEQFREWTGMTPGEYRSREAIIDSG